MNHPAVCAATDGLVCSVITDVNQLEALRVDWLELLGRSATNELMLTPHWLLPWWRVFGGIQGRELKVALFHEGTRLVGLAPLLKRRHWYRPGIPFRRLEPLGTGESSGERIFSNYLGVIAERGAESRVLQALVDALVSGTFGSWDEFVLPAMDGSCSQPEVLVEAFRRAGLAASVVVTNSAPHIPLPGTWEGYLKSLPSSRRDFVTQSVRGFGRWAGGDVQLRWAGTPAELEEGQQVLWALHGERWAGAGRPGAFQSPRFAAFHRAVLPVLFHEGALELLWLCVRGEAVSALYNIVWNGKVYVYQAGRKLSVPPRVRPGIALHGHAIRRAIEDRRREYDLLPGVSQYKTQLALASRPVVQVRAVRPALIEPVHRLADHGIAWARAMRQVIRSGTASLSKFLFQQGPSPKIRPAISHARMAKS